MEYIDDESVVTIVHEPVDGDRVEFRLTLTDDEPVCCEKGAHKHYSPTFSLGEAAQECGALTLPPGRHTIDVDATDGARRPTTPSTALRRIRIWKVPTHRCGGASN